MQVRKLDPENKKDVQAFVEFPFKLYADCPQWVPPLRSQVEGSLNKQEHPSYRHSEVDFFLAQEGQEILGRISVLNNHRHNQMLGTRSAFFGFFEVVEEIEAARLLFKTVFHWAHARGLEEMYGPRGVMSSEGSGALVEGFEHRPAIGIPYNFSYYDSFIKDSGFVKDRDDFSGYMNISQQLPERLFSIAERVKQRRGFWIKSFQDKKEMREWIPRVTQTYTSAFRENYLFVTPTPEELDRMAEDLLTIVEPHLVKLVMKGEEIAGFIFSYPDFSTGLQWAKGRLWPFGLFHILISRRRTKWVNVNGAGLLPQFTGLGANAVLYTELDRTIREAGFVHADIVAVGEDNYESRSDLETMGVNWYKRHRNYRRDLKDNQVG